LTGGNMITEMHIAYDSREQRPLHMISVHCQSAISYHKAALETFDYCVWGDWTATEGEAFVPAFAIERKSMDDFIGSWFNAENRRRELAKIARAAVWAPRPIIYVCDFTLAHLANYDYGRFPSGSIDPRAVASRIDRLRYSGVQVVLAGGRQTAEYVILSLLKRRIGEMGVRHWRRIWAEFGAD